MDNQNLTAQLRLAAQELRKEAAEVRKRKMVKCAQVLTAARGLSQLVRIIRGEA